MTLDPDPLHVEPEPDDAPPPAIYVSDVLFVAILAAALVSAVVVLIVWHR